MSCICITHSRACRVGEPHKIGDSSNLDYTLSEGRTPSRMSVVQTCQSNGMSLSHCLRPLLSAQHR